MGTTDARKWIYLVLLFLMFYAIAIVKASPLNSKAAGWMNNSDEDDRSYNHMRGSNKFSKPYVSQVARSTYYGAARNSTNRTLAAILLLTVFGLAATALLVILCSKMTKKEQYDSMHGTVY